MFQRLAVVGATGAVGRLIRQLLEERNFPIDDVVFLASERSAGTELTFRGRTHTVGLLTPDVFEEIDLCIASTPDDTAREFVPWAVQRKTVVVDESAAWRMDPKVPLVVPEVNADALTRHRGIIASPNCSTTQMVVAMKPIHDVSPIRRVVVSTYQATSGAGVAGERELVESTRAKLDGSTFQPNCFQHPIAFNVIPQIGSEKEQGYTSEEMKMVWETQKIFQDESIRVAATCVRVPVENCHSESIFLETESPIPVEQARELFAEAEGIELVDDLSKHAYPLPSQCSGKDPVYIGRLRKDLSCDNGLTFWCVSDNLRKGAATNAVQIAERLVAMQAATR